MGSRKLKILAVTHNFPRWQGDLPGNFILRLYKQLTKKLEIHVITPAYPGAKKIDNLDGIAIYRFSYGPEYMQRIAYEGDMLKKVQKNPLYSLMMLIFLYKMLELTYSIAKGYKPDLIHAHWIFPGGIIAGIVSKKLNIPLMLSIHGTDLRLAKKNLFLKRLTIWLLRRTRTVVTVSNYLATEVENLIPGVFKAETIPMPVETKKFSPSKKTHSFEKVKIIAVARLTKQKRLDTLLRASQLLSKQGIQHIIQIIGDGPERDSLMRLSKELSSQVEFLGLQPHEIVAKYLREADIFVLPAVDEGFGLAVVEAMLSGLPVILARSGAFTELIDNGKTGFLFQPDNAEELANILSKLVKSPKLFDKISENAVQEAKGRFNQNTIVDRYLRLMQSTIGTNQ